MPLFSIRTVYLHERDGDGNGIFEERILLFRAPHVERAFELAESNSGRYLQLNPTFRRIGQSAAFSVHVDGEGLDATEIWSVLSKSRLEPDEYYRRRYADFEFQEEDDSRQ